LLFDLRGLAWADSRERHKSQRISDHKDGIGRNFLDNHLR
jgi:hypothetical protein